MDDVASGTMSRVTIQKTRRWSSYGELVADTIAKGEIRHLYKIGLSSATLLRSSRVLMYWVKKPTMTPNLGLHLLEEISRFIEEVLPLQCYV